jgi:glycosyltransferase involved in cell wall biosynthesis
VTTSPEAPLVSIIVPVYNRRDVLARGVDSLLAHPFHGPFEIIIVDDGSTDTSAEIAAAYGPPVRLIRQANRGASAARRAGIVAARAPAVTFLDSDDWALPERLQTLWDAWTSRPGLAVAFARARLTDGPWDRAQVAAEDVQDGIIHDPLVALLRRGCFVPSMNFITSQRLADECSRKREHVLAANDWDLLVRLATRGPFAFVDRETLVCEKRADGITESQSARQMGFAILAAVEAVRVSGRGDDEVRSALRALVGSKWPIAAAALWRRRERRLALRVARAGLTGPSRLHNLRRFYWFTRAPELDPRVQRRRPQPLENVG